MNLGRHRHSVHNALFKAKYTCALCWDQRSLGRGKPRSALSPSWMPISVLLLPEPNFYPPPSVIILGRSFCALVLHWSPYLFFSILCHLVIIWGFIFMFFQIFNVLSRLGVALSGLKSSFFVKNLSLTKILVTSSSQHYLKQEPSTHSF